jgi:hypothetical protein
MVRWLLLLLLALFAAGCSNNGRSGADAGTPASISPEGAPAQPHAAHSTPPPRANTKPPPFALSISHVLIQYKGATKATATRSKAEAAQLAEKVLGEACAGKTPFDQLARSYSDAPDKTKGGYLGVFQPWKAYPELMDAVKSVGFDEVVPRVLETNLGFHVVRREKTVHIGHVLVMHTESRNAYAGITRTRAEALEEAERLRGLLAADGADRPAIARRYSECPLTKAIGGDLGYYGRWGKSPLGVQIPPEFVPALAKLGPGDVSPVVESVFGFHVLWQIPEPAPGAAPAAPARDACPATPVGPDAAAGGPDAEGAQ